MEITLKGIIINRYFIKRKFEKLLNPTLYKNFINLIVIHCSKIQ